MKLKVLLIAPTALDDRGMPIKKKKLYLPGLTMMSLAAVTPDDIELTLVNEPVHDIPWDRHWDLVGLTGMGSGLQRAWQIADQFRAKVKPRQTELAIRSFIFGTIYTIGGMSVKESLPVLF